MFLSFRSRADQGARLQYRRGIRSTTLKAATFAFPIGLLLALTTSCSAPSSVTDKLIGTWQSTPPESVTLTFRQDEAPTGPAGEDPGWRHISFTENGRAWAAFWRVTPESSLLLSTAGMAGTYTANHLGSRRIISVSADTLVLEWGLARPERIIEFHRAK